MKRFKKNILVCTIIFSTVFGVLVSSAKAESTFEVSPKIIDAKGIQRDKIERTIILKNNVHRKLNVYAFIHNISPDEGEKEFLESPDADRTTSLANWIQIAGRMAELQAQETKEVEVIIEINMRAKPGIYHARIAFAEGTTRAEAEKMVTENTSILVNLEIKEDIQEWLDLKKFTAEKTFFWKAPITFTYTLENSGNRPIRPQGKVFVYNKKGEEIGVLSAKEEKIIEPGQQAKLVYDWEEVQGFGQLKAMIDVAYGETQRKRAQDTLFFWFIPWQWVLIIFAISGGVLIIGNIWKRKGSARAVNKEHAHQQKESSKKSRPEKQKVIDVRHPK
ncbi:hypothetical protein CL629_00710 [bacterium]|nr:hypothetical protein [bacterium]|tara:strand:- start:3029 stop:4027 length:999 start_codon:yes stop_codon:yes gene_type:complete